MCDLYNSPRVGQARFGKEKGGYTDEEKGSMIELLRDFVLYWALRCSKLWSIMTPERFDAGLLPSSELGNISRGQTEGALEDKLVRRPKKADLLPPATQGQLGNEVFRAASGLVSLLAFQWNAFLKIVRWCFVISSICFYSL